MKRVAIVFEEDIFNQKGTFVSKLERARQLSENPELEVDVFCIQLSYGPIEKLVLGKRFLGDKEERKIGRPESLNFKGLTYNMIWKSYGISDHFLFFKLGLKPIFYPRFLKARAELFKGYDFISAHSFEGALLAREAKRRFGVPFSVTWHGSDIHTKPFKYPCIRKETAELIAAADINYFVSRSLLDVSETIGPGNKTVLFNGVDPAFQKRGEVERQYLRSKNGVQGARVVAFIGNLFPIKQAGLLPKIFASMNREGLKFWVIGDGPLRPEIEAGAAGLDIRFFGDVPHEQVPALMNCIDLLVLPSKAEGLPLVLAEALSSGCKAVGSLTGGIPEVIGEKNCVPLNPDTEAFTRAFAAKATEILFDEGAPVFERERFSWKAISREEVSHILQLSK